MSDLKAEIEIRPLAEVELESLERALGKPVDRQYLAYWVSEAIRDVVKLSMLPTARQLRTDLTRIPRDGRQWLRHVSDYYELFSPRQRAELDQLLLGADVFLASVDFMAAQAAEMIKATNLQAQALVLALGAEIAHRLAHADRGGDAAVK